MEKKQDREKRLAEALRQNLKRRKDQKRDVTAEEEKGATRLFREKPLKKTPPKTTD